VQPKSKTMAKAPTKPTIKAETKSTAKAPAKKEASKPKAKVASYDILKASEEVLSTLKSLNIEQQLQTDMEWCLGSYHADKNPIGLFDMVSRALPIFRTELTKKTKGVTGKLITNLEQVLKAK
jgi:hypothetical protein